VTDAPRTRRRRSRLLLSLLIVAGGLLLLEGAVRVRQYVVHGRASSFYEFELDEASGLRVPRPGITEGRDRLIEVNSLGFRGPELALPKPAGRVRLAFLGGSTTFCAEASGNEATWPALVTAGLARAFPAHSFDYVNAGAAAFTTTQLLTNLTVRVAPTEPDIVVIYEATNDLSFDTREEALRQGLPGTERLGESWLAKNSVAWELLEKNLRAITPAADTGGSMLSYDAAALAEAYRARLTALVREARQRARTVVLVTFAHKQRREQAPDVQRAAATTSLLWMPYMSLPGVLDGFDAYNRVIREVAAAEDVILVEGEDGVPGDDIHFADSVHFTDAGCRLQAERVLAAMLSSPRLDWLRQSP
jgi:lysophospholipase L1-like esterase